MLKRVLSMCLAFALILAAAGCGVIGDGSSNTNSLTSQQDEKDRVVAEAQAYLEENYPDDVFTYVSGRSPDWAYRYYELAFTSQKYDDQEVIVYGDPKKDENPNSVVTSYYKDEEGRVIYDYYDTYYEYSMKDEAEEYFLNVAKKYFEGKISTKVGFYTSIGFAKKIDSKNNFYNNVLNKNVTFYVYINTCVDENNLDEFKCYAEKLLSELVDNGIWTDVFFGYKEKETNDCLAYILYTTQNGIIKEKYND